MKSKIFFIRYAQSTSDLFGCVVATDGTDILGKILTDDFLKRRELSFVNPRNGKRYLRRYGMMVQGGMAVIDVGEYVGKAFVYAMVGINLSCRMYDPYVQIICMDKAFSNIAMIADMVRQSLNWGLSEYGITVQLEPCQKRLEWEVDFVHSYLEGMRDRPFNPMNTFGFEMLEDRFEEMDIIKGRPRKSINIDDYLPKAMRQEMKNWLHEETDQYLYPIDMMRSIRILFELEIIKRPTYEAFVREFEKEQQIAPSTYNSYLNLNNNPYEHDTTYASMKADARKKFLLDSV